MTALRKAAVAGLLAGAVVGIAGTPAQAATGTLTIQSPGAPGYVLLNPRAGCHTVGTVAADSFVRNATDARVVLYPRLGCTGFPGVELPPGGTAVYAPRSILVTS